MGIIVIASAVSSHFGTINTVSLLHVGALEGIVLGLTQWLVLRRYITGIGAIIAW
jgi:hypothetical protein